jgi:tetratricopeptide (TPR) repeat protein
VPDVACESVYAFIDQELAGSEAEAFRQHLMKCESCHARILDTWTIDSAARRVIGRVGKAREPGAGALLRWALVPAGALAGLLVLGGVFGGQLYVQSQRVDPAIYAPFAYRIAEGRLTTPEADLHRPFEPPAKKAVLGEGEGAGHPAPFSELSKLQQRGEYLGVAAAFLERGKPKDALEFVEQAGASARADSDRAAIALFQGEPEKALALADGALAAEPELVQAKWNRALALRELEAWALAARMFEEVAL